MSSKTYCKSRSQELNERKIISSTWSTKNKQQVRKTKEINGKILPYIDEEEIDNSEEMAKYKPTDFSLENLITIGATSTLTEERVLPNTLLIMDNLNHQAQIELNKMTAEDWYNKYINNNNNINQTDKQ